MTTRYNTPGRAWGALDTGYTSEDIPEDFSIPSCTIEDVDRALFELFNEGLPLYYTNNKTTKRVPVIFATGERFAILARKKPLRDKNNAIILPLISISRTGIDQSSGMGAALGTGQPLVVKVQLSKEDPRYQMLMNRFNFNNADDIAIPASATGEQSATPNHLETRREEPSISTAIQRGRNLLKPNLGKNFVEFIQIPPVKHYTASYQIVFWTQYTQQMNSLLTVLMGGYTNGHGRTFSLETKKGYKFVAYVDSALTPENNFSDFTDEERVVRYSFTIKIPAYVVAPQETGLPSPFRRYVSAPQFEFGTSDIFGELENIRPANVPSGDPKAYVLSDIETEDTAYPGAAIGISGVSDAVKKVLSGFPSDAKFIIANAEIGGTFSGQVGTVPPPTAAKFIITQKNPFSGKTEKTVLQVKQQNPNKGETVFREGLEPAGALQLDLGDLVKD